MYLNAAFSNYFVLELVMKSECQGGTDGLGREEFQGGSCAPAPYFPRLYSQAQLPIGGQH